MPISSFPSFRFVNLVSRIRGVILGFGKVRFQVFPSPSLRAFFLPLFRRIVNERKRVAAGQPELT